MKSINNLKIVKIKPQVPSSVSFLLLRLIVVASRENPLASLSLCVTLHPKTSNHPAKKICFNMFFFKHDTKKSRKISKNVLTHFFKSGIEYHFIGCSCNDDDDN